MKRLRENRLSRRDTVKNTIVGNNTNEVRKKGKRGWKKCRKEDFSNVDCQRDGNGSDEGQMKMKVEQKIEQQEYDINEDELLSKVKGNRMQVEQSLSIQQKSTHHKIFNSYSSPNSNHFQQYPVMTKMKFTMSTFNFISFENGIFVNLNDEIQQRLIQINTTNEKDIKEIKANGSFSTCAHLNSSIKKKQKLFVQEKFIKGCTCKKSECTTMYCSCAKGNGFCGDLCSCINCKNTAEYKQGKGGNDKWSKYARRKIEQQNKKAIQQQMPVMYKRKVQSRRGLHWRKDRMKRKQNQEFRVRIVSKKEEKVQNATVYLPEDPSREVIETRRNFDSPKGILRTPETQIIYVNVQHFLFSADKRKNQDGQQND